MTSSVDVAAQLTLADDAFLARFNTTTGAEVRRPVGYQETNSRMAIAAGALIELLDAGSCEFPAQTGRVPRYPDPRIVATHRQPQKPELIRGWEQVGKRTRPKKVKFFLTDLSRALDVIGTLFELGIFAGPRRYGPNGQELSELGLQVIGIRRAGLDAASGAPLDPADPHAQVLASLIRAAGIGPSPRMIVPGMPRERFDEIAVGGEFLGADSPERRAVISVLQRATAPFVG